MTVTSSVVAVDLARARPLAGARMEQAGKRGPKGACESSVQSHVVSHAKLAAIPREDHLAPKPPNLTVSPGPGARQSAQQARMAGSLSMPASPPGRRTAVELRAKLRRFLPPSATKPLAMRKTFDGELTKGGIPRPTPLQSVIHSVAVAAIAAMAGCFFISLLQRVGTSFPDFLMIPKETETHPCGPSRHTAPWHLASMLCFRTVFLSLQPSDVRIFLCFFVLGVTEFGECPRKGNT